MNKEYNLYALHYYMLSRVPSRLLSMLQTAAYLSVATCEGHQVTAHQSLQPPSFQTAAAGDRYNAASVTPCQAHLICMISASTPSALFSVAAVV